MTTQERITQLAEQAHSVRVLLWNASQMRHSRQVFRLQAELDRIIREKRTLERELAR